MKPGIDRKDGNRADRAAEAAGAGTRERICGARIFGRRGALRKRPGVVVLHEFVLHHLVAGLTLGRGDGPGYLGAMQRDAGVVGRLLGHGVLDGVVPPLWEVRPEDFPLAGERVNVNPQLTLSTLTVGTNVPKDDTCTVGGSSYLYNFDIGTGSTAAGESYAGSGLGNIAMGD